MQIGATYMQNEKCYVLFSKKIRCYVIWPSAAMGYVK